MLVQWVNVATAAQSLGVSIRTVRRMMQRGELAYRRCGSAVRIPESALNPPAKEVALRA